MGAIWEGVQFFGKHSWPFKLVLPKEVTVKESETKKGSFRLPPSWTERASPAGIDHRIIVTLKRGFMRANQTFVTCFTLYPHFHRCLCISFQGSDQFRMTPDHFA